MLDLLARLRAEQAAPNWLKAANRADVPTEAVALSLLWADGYQGAVVSPALLGYGPHALLLDNLDGLGVAPCACLHLERDNLEVFVFPQMTLLCGESALRVDLLVGVFRAGHMYWCCGEIDGSSHFGRERWDRQRDLRIRNRVLRFTNADVLSLEFADRLWSRLIELHTLAAS